MMENNVRTIDANALKKVVNETINRMYVLRIDAVGPYADFLDKIDMQPTIDPESLRPVGKWKLHKDGSGTCSQCKFTQKNVWDDDRWQNYCGVCGARMEGE